jgi:hypothetical protein
MDPQRDARLRLAAFRHPAARLAGSRDQAQHRLDEAARAFLSLMAAAGDPHVGPLPPPPGQDRWPDDDPAGAVTGWPVPAPATGPGRYWLATSGRWWLVVADPDGHTVEARPVERPLDDARELPAWRDALHHVLAAARVAR